VLVVIVSYYQKKTNLCQAVTPNQGHGRENAANQVKIGEKAGKVPRTEEGSERC
jgi:hypothetical protein